MENTQTELIKGIQKIMEKSIEANAQILKATSETFSSLLSKPPKMDDLQKLNAEVLSSTISNFMEINLKYAESLIDLGLQLSKDMSAFAESLDKNENPEAGVNVKATSPPQDSALRLSGKPGETVVAAFVLNNNAAVDQNGTFKAGRCMSDATGKLTNIWLKFNPDSFKIAPGEKTDIEISAAIPKSSKPGSYRSAVTVEGFNDTRFEVVVFVEEPVNS